MEWGMMEAVQGDEIGAWWRQCRVMEHGMMEAVQGDEMDYGRVKLC